MAIVELNTNPSTHELRRFGMLALPIVSVVASGWLYGRAHAPAGAAVAAALGAVGWIVGRLHPRLLWPVFVGCVIASSPLAWVLSHVLLAAIFFLLIVPVGILMRLAGRDPLERKFDRSAASYWKPRDAGHDPRAADPARYFRQF
jgi:hypothetical protein